MLANFFDGSCPAGIDEPQGYLGAIFRADSLDQRRVPVGDRTVRAHEDENNRLSRRCQEGVRRGAVKTQRRLLGGRQGGQCQKEKRCRHKRLEDREEVSQSKARAVHERILGD